MIFLPFPLKSEVKFKNKVSKIKTIMFLFGLVTMSCQSQKISFLSLDTVRLAKPVITIDSMLFRNAATLKFNLAQESAFIKYTLDGSEVSEGSALYNSPIKINKTSVVNIKAFHPQYMPSENQEVIVRKMKTNISSSEVTVEPEPNTNYYGDGNITLIDGRKGSINFRNGNRWLGFQEREINIHLKFSRPLLAEKIVVSALQDQGSWIFLPETVSVSSKDDIIGNITLNNSAVENSKSLDFLEIPIKKERYKEINIKVAALQEIPDWHQGKGTLPWLFIDEIIVE